MMPLFAANSIGEYLTESGLLGWRLSEPLAFTIAAVVHAVLILTFFGVAPLVFIWLERKVAGRIQDRLGPTRVGGRFGWLQTLADGIKLIQKEDLCPADADRMLFRMSPYLVFVASFGAFIALPFGNGFVVQNLEVGLFFMLALMSLEVLGVVFAGYSSGSKWALFGGMREAAQVVSYEIPMAICALVPIVAVGTLNMVEIGRIQTGFLSNWLLFQNPFTFIAFFVYFTVATASVKRAPFDLAEAESELVAGFHTEYSGIRWSYFFMAEYASMFAVSGIACYLFLGGWSDGLLIVESIDSALGLSASGWLGAYIVNVIGLAVFVTKATSLVFVQMWVRWTLPRLRIDQVMMTCLKYLLPISCALFLGATLWPLCAYKFAHVLGNSKTHQTVWFGKPLGNRVFEARSGGRTQVAVPAAKVPAEPAKSPEKKPDSAHKTSQAAPRAVHQEGSGEEA